jgi:anthranilate synthase component 1
MTNEAATSTTFEKFSSLRGKNKVISVVRVLFADSDTPVNIYRKAAKSRPGTFLLESAEQGGVWTRFSFVGCGSFGVLGEEDGKAHWQPFGLSEEQLLPGGVSHLAPLDALERVYDAWASPAPAELPPLAAGLVGFIGWDSVRQIEHLPNIPVDDLHLPVQALTFVSELVVIDHKAGVLMLIANVLDDDASLTEDLWRDAQQRLDLLTADLSAPTAAPLSVLTATTESIVVDQVNREQFFAMVNTAQQHIIDGDVFQVVLSQRFDAECSADALDVYRMLRHLNPSPYLYMLSLEDNSGIPFSIVGSSPEALVTVKGPRILTHPIAGSRPRGATVEDDLALELELLADDKERAEHVMLVDLSRNDLLKVCVPSTLDVSEFMRIERFSHIMHIVSSVEGELRPECTLVDVFRATFPAGTLSGAPKPRALEIIDDLESTRRGVYGGIVGYFGFGGDADLAIAIRTATIKEGTAYVQAGAGIVADSDALSEFNECRNKAAAPLRAVSLANALKKHGVA